jgi:hypothetical protein
VTLQERERFFESVDGCLMQDIRGGEFSRADHPLKNGLIHFVSPIVVQCVFAFRRQGSSFCTSFTRAEVRVNAVTGFGLRSDAGRQGSTLAVLGIDSETQGRNPSARSGCGVVYSGLSQLRN